MPRPLEHLSLDELAVEAHRAAQADEQFKTDFYNLVGELVLAIRELTEELRRR